MAFRIVIVAWRSSLQWNKAAPSGRNKRKAVSEIERLKKLVKVQQKYIEVLGAEINSFAPLMWSHGWKSEPSQIRRGKACRDAIEKLSK